MLLGCVLADESTGSISLAFFKSNGLPLDPAVLKLGETITLRVTISPLATAPLRLKVLSTLPQVITPSHDKLFFSTDQTVREISLVSPVNGVIGTTSIFVSADLPGTYATVSANVLVQGSISAVAPACVSVNDQNKFTVTIKPPAPTSVSLTASISTGTVSPSVLVIPNGQSTGTFTVTGGSILANSAITISNNLYGSYVLNFANKGGFSTTLPSSFIAGAPQNVVLRKFPSNAVANVGVVSSNLHISPSGNLTFSSGVSSQTLEFSAIASGPAKVTYYADNFCNHTDSFLVGAGPVCPVGNTADFTGAQCVPCPGNRIDPRTGIVIEFTNSCNLRGECTYSRTVALTATCQCDSPFYGPACEYSPSSQVPITTTVYNGAAKTITVPNVDDTTAPMSVSFPASMLSNSLLPVTVYITPYDRDYPFPGAVDPVATAPIDTIPTDISFNLQLASSDNTKVPQNTALAPITISVVFDFDEIPENLANRAQLRYWNGTAWLDATSLCADPVKNFDYSTHTFTTTVCRQGLYAVFLIPPTNSGAGTGRSNVANPDLALISGGRPEGATTGVTGYAPRPPTGPHFTLGADNRSSASSLNVSWVMMLVMGALSMFLMV